MMTSFDSKHEANLRGNLGHDHAINREHQMKIKLSLQLVDEKANEDGHALQSYI